MLTIFTCKNKKIPFSTSHYSVRLIMINMVNLLRSLKNDPNGSQKRLSKTKTPVTSQKRCWSYYYIKNLVFLWSTCQFAAPQTWFCLERYFTCARWRNYSRRQREFCSEFVPRWVKFGITWPDPPQPSAGALLPGLRPVFSKFCYAVDLRPANRFTFKHQFLMSLIKSKILQIGNSEHFFHVNFAVSC